MPNDAVPPSHDDLIEAAAAALRPQQLASGDWVGDVGAAVESIDGQMFTGASVGGYLGICAEQGAVSQLVTTTQPIIRRLVAVWREPDTGALHVLPPCGRCREFIRTLAQANLDATVVLGPSHTATLRELLPVAGWHAEPV